MEKEGKPAIPDQASETVLDRRGQKTKKQSRLILILIVSTFAVLILSFFVILPFFLQRLDAYVSGSLITANAPSDSPSAIGTKAPVKKPAPSKSSSDVPECTPAQVSYPEGMPISTDDPGIKLNSSDAYYKIYGSTISDLNYQIYTCGPKSDGGAFAGITTDYINWIYLMRFDADGTCRVDDASVGVNVAILYPDWEGHDSASDQTKERWTNMISNLRIHEEGHRQIDYDGGREILNQISSISASSCQEVENLVNSTARSTIDSTSQKNEYYDDETNHGESQGAHF